LRKIVGKVGTADIAKNSRKSRNCCCPKSQGKLGELVAVDAFAFFAGDCDDILLQNPD